MILKALAAFGFIVLVAVVVCMSYVFSPDPENNKESK